MKIKTYTILKHKHSTFLMFTMHGMVLLKQLAIDTLKGLRRDLNLQLVEKVEIITYTWNIVQWNNQL